MNSTLTTEQIASEFPLKSDEEINLALNLETLKNEIQCLEKEIELSQARLDELYDQKSIVLRELDETLPQCSMHYNNDPLDSGVMFVIVSNPEEEKIILRKFGTELIWKLEFVWNKINGRYEPMYNQVVSQDIHLRNVPVDWIPTHA